MIKIKSNSRNKRTFLEIDKMPSSNYKSIRASLFEIGSDNVSHLRKMIRTGDRSGRYYGSHRASAPGEAPAARPNSRLTRTLQYKVRGDFQCEFGDTVPYGGFLEDGTHNMAARPHVSRTVREKQRDVRDIFRRNLDPQRMLK